MRIAIVGLVLTLGSGTSVVAQSSWCRYKPGRLHDIIDEERTTLNDTLPPDHRNWVVNTAFRGAKAPVVYLGQSRRLAGLDSSFLDGYFHRVLPDSAFRALFHNQARFVDGLDTLWLAIQDSLLPALVAEAQPGELVTLFTSYLGARQEGRSTFWVFVINEFATRKSQAQWDRTLNSCPH